jgi:thiol-disulfide isomerase/thioredoxin
MSGTRESKMLKHLFNGSSSYLRWTGIGIIVLLAVWVSLQPAEAMIGKPAPEIANATWLNSGPLRMADLQGKVVMVEFWTFGCFNCRNVEPYVKQWHQQYADQGLVVIGVHSPEFLHERDVGNVKRYIKEHDMRFAVPIDNDFSTWNSYGNRYWPAIYLIDKRGIIRYIKIGEGGYAETEQHIQTLLAERL